MGDIAEMMLDGTLCECCGTYIGHDTGFPGYCSPQCAGDRGADWYVPPKPKRRRRRKKTKAKEAPANA